MASLNEREVRLEQLMPLIEETLALGNTVTFAPKGISMLPLLRQGVDSVVLSPVPLKLKKYDLPLYRRDNGKFVLHRVVEAGETYTCVGDNQFDYEPGLRHDQMIAIVTAFYRGEKLHSIDELGYRIYCRFWHYTRPLRRFKRRCLAWIRRLLK